MVKDIAPISSKKLVLEGFPKKFEICTRCLFVSIELGSDNNIINGMIDATIRTDINPDTSIIAMTNIVIFISRADNTMKSCLIALIIYFPFYFFKDGV
jgi:hypothetical protein